MSDLEGVMLSDYLLLQCINKGGMADVYRARQNGEGNYEVAVKIFRPSYAQRASFRDYFMTEAEKIGQFDHPNILPFLEFGEGEDLLYVVTPFVPSGTLEDLLVRVGGKFSAMQALPIMQQLCGAVQYAHDHDVLHGNIKPSNVFLAADGRMLLSDFGIASGYDDSQQSLTRVGWGSAEYTAPEQSLGVLRHASDIYALGVLLFRILTGQLPFTGQTPVEVLLKHVRQQPPSARALVPSISDAVDAVLRMALQKRADDRFASAEELSNAFLAAVSLAPVASPVAKSISIPAPQPAFGQPLPVSNSNPANLDNPQTPVPAVNTASALGDSQTPMPVPLSFSSSAPSVPPPSAPKGEDADVSNATDGGKHRFWSVDPVEWSPIADAQVDAVPLTADDYLHSKPMVPEASSAVPVPSSASTSKKVEDSKGSRLNEMFHKLLPIVVVILLLLGLLGALLSSFFYPNDDHGAHVTPRHEVYTYTIIREGRDG